MDAVSFEKMSSKLETPARSRDQFSMVNNKQIGNKGTTTHIINEQQNTAYKQNKESLTTKILKIKKVKTKHKTKKENSITRWEEEKQNWLMSLIRKPHFTKKHDRNIHKLLTQPGMTARSINCEHLKRVGPKCREIQPHYN